MVAFHAANVVRFYVHSLQRTYYLFLVQEHRSAFFMIFSNTDVIYLSF